MQAPQYTRTTDFSEDEVDNVSGRSTVRTSQVDAELDDIATSINALITNQSLNQRDDGEIRDGRVKVFTLASDVLALLTSYGATPRGPWVTATAYAVKDLVSQGGPTYICVSAHTSGVFATDLAASKWLLFSLSAAPSATQVTFTPTANIAATNVQAAIEESDSENRALSAAAVPTASLASSVSAVLGPNLVGYDSALAYAQATVGGRLNYYVTPTDAVADGTTDDYVELAARIAATPTGGTLLLQPGKNYRIGTKLVINKAMTLLGYGAKLNTGSSHITAIEVTASDVNILGVEIEGAGNASFNTAGKLIVVTGTVNGAAVAPTRIRRVLIRDCHLYEAGRCGVQTLYAEQVRVIDNRIHDVAYCAVEFLSVNETQADYNDIRDVTPGTSGNMYAIFYSQVNDADTVRYPQCEQVSACHNHIENVDWEGIDCHGGDVIDFSHNTLINCGDSNAAIAIIHADDAGSTPIVPATNVRVVGNTIKGSQQYGIATSSGSATVIHKNITILGNTLDNCGASNTSNDVGGIRIGAARNVSVIGNALEFCAPYGVIVNSQYAAGVSIEGNTFRRVVSNTETTPAPILIDRGASGTGAITIGGNTLLLAATGETYEAVNGVRVVSTDGGNIKFLPNNFDAASTTKYSVSATQWNGGSFPVVNAGNDSIAVTTAVATASKAITLPIAHSANTVYVPTAVIFSTQASDERTLIHCTRTSTTQITVTVYTAGGANFPANGNINFFWETKGL